MIRFMLCLLLSVGVFISSQAQNLLNKVPSNASMVIKYAAENFSKNLPLKKIDSYGFVRENLNKALKIDTLTSLENLGINFEKDVYQYVTMADSTVSFVSLFYLKDPQQFLKLVDANLAAEMKPESRNGYQSLVISSGTYIGWNNEQAVMVVSSYQNPNRYYYDYSTVVDSVSVATVYDTAVVVEEIKEEPVIKPKPAKPTTKGKKKPAVGQKKNAKQPAKKAAPKKKPVEIIDQEIKPEEDIIVEAPKETNREDSIRDAKRQDWEREQEKKTSAKQKHVADSIINSSFTGNISSINNDISYKKVIDPAAHVAVWVNYDNVLRQYWSTIYRGFGGYRHWGPDYMNNSKTNNDGFRSGMNLYFEKSKVRMEQRSFSPDEQMANLGRDLFNSKQNPSLANFVNPDNIGYLSMSINSEAMANYYYKLMKQYMQNYPYISEYSDIVDVYIDLLEIIIDEKAIAELMPGNYMFVLHDMKTRQVSYTDYEYDSDFKYKEVQKTKQELSPNFTFIMETKKESFMKKVLNLPLKYAEKGKYNYKDKGGYYELAFDSGRYPISSLYFMLKDGRLMVTTSKASVDMALNNSSYTLDAEARNAILSNNYSLKINSKKLFEQLESEFSTDVNKKIAAYLEENIGDMKMESSLKDGMMQGTTTMTIKGDHANSLEFFFNMVDAINNIIEKDKEEKEKKLN